MKLIIIIVLSDRVSKALDLTGDEAKETAKFVQMFDEFFDCLNEQFHKRQTPQERFPEPYRKTTDFRLKVILWYVVCTRAPMQITTDFKTY